MNFSGKSDLINRKKGLYDHDSRPSFRESNNNESIHLISIDKVDDNEESNQP